MELKKYLYFSPLGRIISLIQNALSFISRPYMVYGYKSKFDNKFKKYTRISSSSIILNKENLNMGDNVWVSHYSIIDSSNNVTIGDGCQMGAWLGIFTHSSHVSVRLYGGKSYIETKRSERLGFLIGPVTIGNNTFIGAKVTIMPNVTIGKGCLIAAGTIVNKSFPDFSIISGNPAKLRGSTFDLDKRYLSDSLVQKNYFDKKTLTEFLKNKHK